MAAVQADQVKLSVQVMAHPRREHMVGDLVGGLGVRTDQVTWDRRNDRWDTGRRAWLAHDSTATHHMVIQDDAVVSRDLLKGLERALSYVPAHSLVSPFVGTRRPAKDKVLRVVAQAEQVSASWIVMDTLNWGVAIIAPTWTIPDMIAWCDTEEYPNYDKRVGRYYWRCLNWATWYTWPNLVDHHDGPSLVNHGPGRHSHRFIGTEASALDQNWAGPAVRMAAYGRGQRRQRIDMEKTHIWHGPKGRRRVTKAGSRADDKFQADPVWKLKREAR